MSASDMVLPDFPPGPLDTYRKCASFSWKALKIAVESEELLKFKMKIWKTLEDDPLFQHSPLTPSLDELRHLAVLQCKKIRQYNFLPVDETLQKPHKAFALLLAIIEYDLSVGLKYFVPFTFFISSLRDLGTSKHYHFIQAAENDEISGCYALTEVAHGSDAKNMRTTATFDPTTQEFVINSADFEAAKCWVGSLGKTATHATLFAQLITPDGVNHGLHGFLVPLRDVKTMLPYPGVIIGDMGEKVGVNGVDNGFAMFNNYRIPKDNLLDKMGGVSPEGKYISPVTDPRKRFAASLSTLLTGRVGIVGTSSLILAKAVVMAVRYSAVRRQFGATDDEELPVIEYQLQQWRLFPYLAASYALKILSVSSINSIIEVIAGMYLGADKEKLEALITELHFLQSSAKGLSTWTAQKAIQECREACGGHGYLKCSGFGILRNDNDTNCTYEGDNNVLCQQTSYWLLQLWTHRNNPAREFSTPLGSVSFIYNKPTSSTFTATTVNEMCQFEEILAAYDWLVVWLLQMTANTYENHKKKGKDSFTARNDSQVYFARSLSFVYTERYVILNFWNFCNSGAVDKEEKAILKKLCLLYGLWCLEKHTGDLYEGGYAVGPLPSKLIKEGIIELCLQLKPEAVSLADALAPPDFILNSAIGKSDGQLYKNIQTALLQSPGVMERPAWWTDLIAQPKSKL